MPLVMVRHLMPIERPFILEGQQTVIEVRLLPFPIFIAIDARFRAECLPHHVINDRFEFGQFFRLDPNMGQQGGHRLLLCFGEIESELFRAQHNAALARKIIIRAKLDIIEAVEQAVPGDDLFQPRQACPRTHSWTG